MAEATSSPRRSTVRKLTGVKILSTGSYVPDVIVRNEDLASLGFDADWILQRTGIEQRRHAPPEMATSDLAAEAGRRCLESAGVDPADVDLLIVGTFTPDVLCPATAPFVQDRLKLACPAFDVQAACAGFVYSLVTGMQYVASGNSRLALVIGADTNSRIVNPKDKKTYPLFGDGAGAVLLAPGGPRQGLLAYTLGTDGSGAELLYRRMGGSREPTTCKGLEKNLQFLSMEGRPVFKWAIRLIHDTIHDVLAASNMTIDEVDFLVLHQANMRIIDAAAGDLGIPREKVLANVERYGNTSAASIPLVLDEALRDGRIKPGSRIALCGFGAGLAWGTAVLQW